MRKWTPVHRQVKWPHPSCIGPSAWENQLLVLLEPVSLFGNYCVSFWSFCVYFWLFGVCLLLYWAFFVLLCVCVYGHSCLLLVIVFVSNIFVSLFHHFVSLSMLFCSCSGLFVPVFLVVLFVYTILVSLPVFFLFSFWSFCVCYNRYCKRENKKAKPSHICFLLLFLLWFIL